MNTDKKNPSFLAFLSVFIRVHPWPIMSLPGLEKITLIPRHREVGDSSRFSSIAVSNVPVRRDESRNSWRRGICGEPVLVAPAPPGKKRLDPFSRTTRRLISTLLESGIHRLGAPGRVSAPHQVKFIRRSSVEALLKVQVRGVAA